MLDMRSLVHTIVGKQKAGITEILTLFRKEEEYRTNLDVLSFIHEKLREAPRFRFRERIRTRIEFVTRCVLFNPVLLPISVQVHSVADFL